MAKTLASSQDRQDAIGFGLTFDDVLLEPRASEVTPATADVSATLTKKIKLRLPLLAAAMDTVSGVDMAIALGRLGGLAVLHRNCTTEEEAEMVRKVKKAGVICGAAVGPHDIERARALDKAGADILFVDCAHAHNLQVVRDAKTMKKITGVQIVVGNIATADAASALAKFADAIKVGVGPGSICTTRVVAGVGVPQLTAILNVVKVAKKSGVPVIADGGIKYSGDVVKALAAGASCVMLGSMLAGCDEAPGEIVEINGKKMKSYRGMGSLSAMRKNQSSDRYFQKGSKKYVPEGVEGAVPCKGPMKETVEQIIGGLKSGMGYIGAKAISDMPKQARFVRITRAGLAESHPHDITITKKAPNY